MAYTINKSDGTVLTTVADATLDETTNLGLIGQGIQVMVKYKMKTLSNY